MTSEPPCTVRSARTAEVAAIFGLSQAFAAYEHLRPAVTGTPAALTDRQTGDRPCAEAIVAEWEGQIAGFALFFQTYSTFRTQPGLYLDDLFVLPDRRRQGSGTVLLRYLARLAIAGGCGRFEWSVLDWHASAIAFYAGIGAAAVLPDWRPCRLEGERLALLADRP